MRQNEAESQVNKKIDCRIFCITAFGTIFYWYFMSLYNYNKNVMLFAIRFYFHNF